MFFGRDKEPKKLTRETPMRRFSLKVGGYGPRYPLSDIANDEEIDFLNTIQEHTGRPLDLYLPPSSYGGLAVDMSDPETQKLVAGLDDQIKQSIAERGGRLALAEAVDENGNLKW